ncbi:hypothetical protein DFS34DRAFT_616914 [Phlyctochytrium arcticum]|nr:hypothetical protein DFS34DRAFT_616914 [Phlyctochytrium arcticum]
MTEVAPTPVSVAPAQALPDYSLPEVQLPTLRPYVVQEKSDTTEPPADDKDWIDLEGIAVVTDAMTGLEVSDKEDSQPKEDEPTTSAPTSGFVDMIDTLAARTTTENGANAYKTSLDAHLDFDTTVLPHTPKETVFSLLNAAWAQDPQTALRCIFHLRDIRSGKGDAEKFSDALLWLYGRHPGTLLANLRWVPRVGYWKDLLNFLVRLTIEEDAHAVSVGNIRDCQLRKPQKAAMVTRTKKAWQAMLAKGQSTDTKRNKNTETTGAKDLAAYPKNRIVNLFGRYASKSEKASLKTTNPITMKPWSARALRHRKRFKRLETERKSGGVERDLQKHIQLNESAMRVEQDKASQLRREKRAAHSKKLATRFTSDSLYRRVHIKIAQLFAQALYEDKIRMEAGKRCGLVSKWAPSLGGHHDKATFIASTIAQILASDAKPGPTESWSNFVIRVRIKYNKDYIVPLRKHTKVVETHLGYGQVAEINYEHVPAHSMRRNRPKFQELDEERFTEYLGAVSKGEKTIAAGSLKPHQLVSEVWSNRWDRGHQVEETEDATLLRENQWTSYVNRIKKVGQLKHAMAICDVSDSMSGEPMDVCIALGLLCSQVTEPPFNGLLCTFSQNPQFFKVPAGTLKDKVAAIAGMQWSMTMTTNFEAVFDLLLQTAIAKKLPADEMVSTLLVFSDMEFDQATNQAGTWTTIHDGAAAKFAAAGYTLPSIVYWNLRGNTRANGNDVSLPAVNSTKGVAMVSGFSGQMLKLFMDGDMDFTPSKILAKSLDPYKCLRVAD